MVFHTAIYKFKTENTQLDKFSIVEETAFDPCPIRGAEITYQKSMNTNDLFWPAVRAICRSLNMIETLKRCNSSLELFAPVLKVEYYVKK